MTRPRRDALLMIVIAVALVVAGSEFQPWNLIVAGLATITAVKAWHTPPD